MTEKPKKRRKMKEAQAVETHPDAWERFESAVRQIVPPKRGKPEPDKDEQNNE